MIPKRPKLSSRKHRMFVANHRCVVCSNGYLGRDPDPTMAISQCAHVSYVAREHDGMRGKGQKARDLWTVPLCPYHHAQQHNWRGGEKRFWEYAGDPEPICIELAENSPDPLVREAIAQLREAA